MDCLKKTQYHINKTETNKPKPPVLQTGIDMHNIADIYMKTGDVGPLPYKTDLHELHWKNLEPYLFKWKRDLLSSEQKIYTNHPIPLDGILDLLLEDYTIIDYKFTNKPWTDRKANDYISKQAWIYFELVKAQYGVYPKKLIYAVFPAEGQIKLHTVLFDNAKLSTAYKLWKDSWGIIKKAEE